MRMSVAALPALLLGACGQAPEPALDDGSWQDYRSRFLSESGRIVDTGQDGISHSEGQAYAMLLAEAAADRKGFDRIWRWADTRLRIRDDALLAWKWDPAAQAVADPNNATDADLLAAWALLRASERWEDESYREEARRLLDDVARLLVVQSGFGPVLLPGAAGFVHDGVVTVNLSYWVFPALSEFARTDPDGPWLELRASGLSLLDAARFGDSRLPVDWVIVGRPPLPSRLFPIRFGFEAMRIPLYACWDGIDTHPALEQIAGFWSSADHPPAWLAPEEGTGSAYSLGPGGMAVRRLLLDRLGIPVSSAASSETDTGDELDYYDATLLLLTTVARHESRS
jgi:endo-1,4-beta-D-glucanase Y